MISVRPESGEVGGFWLLVVIIFYECLSQDALTSVLPLSYSKCHLSLLRTTFRHSRDSTAKEHYVVPMLTLKSDQLDDISVTLILADIDSFCCILYYVPDL